MAPPTGGLSGRDASPRCCLTVAIMISLIEQVEPVHDPKDHYGKGAARKRGCQEYESLTDGDHRASLQTISESAINTIVPKKILTLARARSPQRCQVRMFKQSPKIVSSTRIAATPRPAALFPSLLLIGSQAKSDPVI